MSRSNNNIINLFSLMLGYCTLDVSVFDPHQKLESPRCVIFKSLAMNGGKMRRLATEKKDLKVSKTVFFFFFFVLFNLSTFKV